MFIHVVYFLIIYLIEIRKVVFIDKIKTLKFSYNIKI
jgi:hypothetical protein